MHLPHGVTFAKEMIKLLKEFYTHENITPTEFMESKICGKSVLDDEVQELYKNFLLIMKHEGFFNAIVETFWNCYKLKPLNKELITTYMYAIIFLLDDDNFLAMTKMFVKSRYRHLFNLVKYFEPEENTIEITQAACRLFDNEYVLQNVLYPLLNKKSLVDALIEVMEKEEESKHRVIKKSLTEPRTPRCAKRMSRVPAVPLNTPAEVVYIKSSAIPNSVFEGSRKLQKDLEKAKEINRVKALRLLEKAQRQSFKCAVLTKRISAPPEVFKIPHIKHTRIPIKKEVNIKKNAASLLREAAVLVKDRESEIKKIEALTQAVFDPLIYERLEDEMRKCRDQEYIQDIERKHLQGLLTYEEAILAKQKLLKVNQEKMEEFKMERMKILEEIELWKEAEQEKIRILVEKSQTIEKAAKESEKKMQAFKRVQARIFEAENKELLKLAYERQKEELVCKVKLIQELRALHQIRSTHVKEFDPTESPNFGLLCEMSIAELQERLNLLKVELNEELEKRRKAVTETRQKQQQLIEDVKQFIGQSRVAKPKPVPRAPCKLEQTPEIIALRERLQQARILRMGAQQQPNTVSN